MLLRNFYEMFLCRGTKVEIYKFGQYGDVPYHTGIVFDTPASLLDSFVYAVMSLDDGVLGIGVELEEDEQ